MKAITAGTCAFFLSLSLVACGAANPVTANAPDIPTTYHAYASYDLKTLKKLARTIAVVEVTKVGEATFESGPVNVNPDSPEYPYAPGRTPPNEQFPMVKMTGRVSASLKGPIKSGDLVSFVYSKPDTSEVTAAAQPGSYLVFLTNRNRDGDFNAVSGPLSVFVGSQVIGNKKVYRSIIKGSDVNQVTAAEASIT